MKKVNKQLGMLQRAGAEKLGRAEKSVEELPEHITLVQRHHETTRINCERVQKKLNNSFQGSGSEYEKRVRKLPHTALANCLHEASSELGTTPLAQVMDLCGDVMQRIAMQTACFELLLEEEVQGPLTKFLETDALALEKLFKKLQKSRLEMDSAASKLHKLEKRPAGGNPVQEQEEKRARLEVEETEKKFHSLQGHYITDLLEVASKEHAMAGSFVTMMENQVRYHEECLSRLQQTVPKMREIVDTTPFRPVFGVDLTTHCTVNNRPLSLVIESCCSALLPYIETEEGLFRIAGSVTQVKKLKANIDYGLLDFSDCSPHTITGVLKQYLRALPDPLFTEERYENWKAISVLGEQQHSEKMQSAYSHLHDLPTVNYENIRYLMVFLQRMTTYQSVTKMGASNLALVIGPNLFVSSDKADGRMNDTGPLCTLVEALITHSEYFFPEGDDLSPDSNLSPAQLDLNSLEGVPLSTEPIPPTSKRDSTTSSGLGKASAGASNSSSRSRVLSGASSAANAVSNLRSKLKKDKERGLPEKPEKSDRLSPATSSPLHSPASMSPQPPAVAPYSPPSSSTASAASSSSTTPSSHSQRPLVPQPHQPHPSRNISPPGSSTSPPPRPTTAPRPVPGSSSTSPSSPQGAPPSRPSNRPTVPNRSRTTTA